MASSSSSCKRLLVVIFVLSISCAVAVTSTSTKVSLAFYYETLCPYCSRFMVNHLGKIFQDGLIDIVDLDLVPYGNAHVQSNGTITCQHGEYECLLNTVEACAISAWPDLDVHFSFIYCVESLVVEQKYLEWETCFAKLGLDSKSVLDCFENGKGEKLELQYAAKTNSLEPPHTYVPWVVVNGQPLYDDYENFESYICKAYKGDLPKACEGLALKTMKGTKATHNVCSAEDISLPTTGQNNGMKIKVVV